MVETIKKIREITGAGVVDIKKALEEAQGDEKQAVEILRKKGLENAEKKGDREAREGVVMSYVHGNGKIAGIVKIFCETDFVAKNDEFQELARDIAMQIVAMNPNYHKPEDVSKEEVESHKEIWKKDLVAEGKTEDIAEKALAGKEDKFRKENALLTQAFVKNPDLTIEDYVKEKIAKLGENIQIGEFFRMEI
ncbi:MAG: elongation factor Ts [Patescibacteria group bacterium]|jgi:elongation factor Ts|nr:elongation factor Ts [Patescibacteria group bacterium]